MSEFLRLLEDLKERISRVERRLSNLESGRIIFDERKVVGNQGEIEGKRYIELPGGGIAKEISVPVCDFCGKKLDSFYICVECGKKVCDECAIRHRNRNLCVECLKRELPLEKREYKVLVAVANGITCVRKISRVTRIGKKGIKLIVEGLRKRGFIEKEGFFLFSNLYTTDSGLEAISAYRQVYGMDDDVLQFDLELREMLYAW